MAKSELEKSRAILIGYDYPVINNKVLEDVFGHFCICSNWRNWQLHITLSVCKS